MACESIFLEKLRKSGLRLTPQREMVLSVMHQIEGAATVEEIHSRVRALSTAVDISTVYRTLDLLRAFGLVARVETGHEQHLYEHLGVHGPHLHLVCQSCGNITGVDLQEATPFLAKLRATHGFEGRLDDVTIPGLCWECQVAKRSEKATA